MLLLITSLLTSFCQLHNYEVDKPLNIGHGYNMDIDHKSIAEKNKMLQSLNHGAWNNLLKKHVDAKGNVNYQNFKNDIEVLEKYLEYLANNTPERQVDINERLAYYINLYNAATVKLVLDNYPVQSIKDIDSPWGKKRVRVGGKMLSLGHIEHKILRKMNEPRIHFAINCASFSCPKLLNEAFVAQSIPSQLQRVTIDFINDKTRNIITKDRLQLSNIFKWYKKDFTHSSSLAEYINAYTNESIESNAKIQFLKYNWNLNENE
ncbi:DUF547 domain-containing protein [Muriicola sp. Z0-33]|uniref:DUF547 domain-containing protein n=1 Tax=Muriicola sp. Z0-33 TaxID=2816957 RepID=UPI002237C32C|nr:DUF547 domain-containing protein [Muriicola sp. Z0-33]